MRNANGANGETLGEWLAREPFTLALSSGFFGFFAHAGVACALAEHGIAPAAFSGSSAGALVGGALAAGVSPTDLARELAALRRRDFWDPAPGPGLLRGRLFLAHVERMLPAVRFEDCARPVVVSAFDVRARRTRTLDSGALAPVIVASCAVPLMFWPVRHDGALLYDGGIADRPGLAGVAPGARVFHHHLSSRSPWRRRRDPALEPPQREGLVSIVIRDLPRSGPTQLDAGVGAMELARERTHAALGGPVSAVIQL